MKENTLANAYTNTTGKEMTTTIDNKRAICTRKVQLNIYNE